MGHFPAWNISYRLVGSTARSTCTELRCELQVCCQPAALTWRLHLRVWDFLGFQELLDAVGVLLRFPVCGYAGVVDYNICHGSASSRRVSAPRHPDCGPYACLSGSRQGKTWTVLDSVPLGVAWVPLRTPLVPCSGQRPFLLSSHARHALSLQSGAPDAVSCRQGQAPAWQIACHYSRRCAAQHGHGCAHQGQRTGHSAHLQRSCQSSAFPQPAEA